MVGAPGTGRRTVVVVRPAVDAYSATAEAWADGPARMYAALARAVVAHCPMPLIEARVLDLGAGTGAASTAAADLGGHVVAVDAAFRMLCHSRHGRPPAAVGDAYHLPLASGTFDCVIAAFVLNHLDKPVSALRETRRVLRRGGIVVASTYAGGWNHPAKAHVDRVAADHGFTSPAWYVSLKRQVAPVLGERAQLASAARAAGLTAVDVQEITVDTGLKTAEDLVRWRLGMAHLAPFMGTLSATARERIRQEAIRAVADDPLPVMPEVLVLLAAT